MNLTKSSGLSNDNDHRNLTMLQESVAKQELVTYDFAPGAVPVMRAPSNRQGLHDAENPDSVRNSRDQGRAMDSLPALPSSHMHGVHGSQ